MTTPSALFDLPLFDEALFGAGQLSGLAGMSAGKLIYAALRKAAVTLGPQRTPSHAAYQDGVEELNRLMGSLACDRYFVYTLEILSFPLEAGKKVYTIGQTPSGAATDFPTQWPIMITGANAISGDLR